ncbi:MAG: chemotaxis-specific protein-glutamate methyltransferase CheB [Chloroflexaceae bacterium]|nr:chemotaxis-specific protein-glutamate methyltransferase CheB [Chloroflexaceae bacterium]
MSETIRVLVVDDSSVVRGILQTFLESDPAIRVVGAARNGQEALTLAGQLHPNVITMDVRMPVMDGLTTTEHLMAYQPTPILVVSSTLNNPDVDVAFQMLAAGALDVIETPPLTSPDERAAYRTMLIRRVKLLAGMRVVTHLRGRRTGRVGTPAAGTPVPTLPPPATALAPRSLYSERTALPAPPLSPPAPTPPPPFPLIVIGASAGGPRIVQYILKQLPATLPAAVLLVQHIADGFTAGMADWLDGHTDLRVQVATDQLPLQTRTVLVAADGYDILVSPEWQVALRREGYQAGRPRPSVDVAMQSVAQVFGSHTIAVILSGMGNDGAQGMRDIHAQGGYTLAQNEATCPIFGMPRAAIELGVVDQVLPPEGIVAAILHRLPRLSRESTRVRP